MKTLSFEAKAFCERFSKILDNLPNEDERKAQGLWILYLINSFRLRMNKASYEYLLTFDDPLEYLIDISRIRECATIFNNKVAYNIRTTINSKIRARAADEDFE
jgi:hypothetical protein